MGVFTLKMLCLLGSVLWTFFEYQMTLAILVIAVQFYYPHNDATKVYVPKRIRKPNIILKHIFPLLKSLATWLEHQVSNIKVKVKVRPPQQAPTAAKGSQEPCHFSKNAKTAITFDCPVCLLCSLHDYRSTPDPSSDWVL